jgi:CDP-diacylglycerol--glycerol-3-phosphate 3-phosphatidyltransferase
MKSRIKLHENGARKKRLKLLKRIQMKDNIANMVTGSRIVFALLLLIVPVFSIPFWTLYLCGGISDMLDGFVARKLGQQSDFGSKLDSISDVIFCIVVITTFYMNTKLPVWIWYMTGIVALIRIMAYIVGFFRFHRFVSLHTYANKISGFMLFVFPLLYYIIGINASGMLIGAITGIAALEELLIICRMKSLNRECRFFFDILAERKY